MANLHSEEFCTSLSCILPVPACRGKQCSIRRICTREKELPFDRDWRNETVKHNADLVKIWPPDFVPSVVKYLALGTCFGGV